MKNTCPCCLHSLRERLIDMFLYNFPDNFIDVSLYETTCPTCGSNLIVRFKIDIKLKKTTFKRRS